MSRSLRKLLGIGLLVGLCSVSAWAKPGEQRVWAIQDTGLGTASTGQTALGMKSGLVWPVIFTDLPTTSAYTLVPAGGRTPGAGSWQPMGTNLFSRSGTRFRVASNANGSMVVYGGSSSTGVGSIYTPAGGWAPLGNDVTAATFDKSGKLITATRNAVAGLPALSGVTIMDVAVSPAGDVGVIDSSARYWQYESFTGRWLSTSFSTSPAQMGKPESMDLEFDSFGRPHIVGMAGSSIYAFDFSTITGTWQTSTLMAPGGISSLTGVSLIANGKGEVATAWVSSTNSDLVFAYKPDNADWVTSVVASDASRTQRQLGLAYDYMDNPVISYISGSRVMLAYDPVAVPEPSALGLLVVSGLLAMRRRAA